MCGIVDWESCSVEWLIEECIYCPVVGVGVVCRVFKSVEVFVDVCYLHFVGVVELVDGSCLDGGEHVVLIGLYELVERTYYIVPVTYGYAVHGEFAWQISWLVERVGELCLAVDVVGTGAIGYVAVGEEVWREVGIGEC